MKLPFGVLTISAAFAGRRATTFERVVPGFSVDMDEAKSSRRPKCPKKLFELTTQCLAEEGGDRCVCAVWVRASE